MPSPSDPNREPRFYVEDMLEFCTVVLGWTHGLTQNGLMADRMRWDASLRNLELIGEAATHVPDDIRALAPDVPWRRIIDARNRLAHAYLRIGADTVWSIIQSDLPALRDALIALLDRLPPATPGG